MRNGTRRRRALVAAAAAAATPILQLTAPAAGHAATDVFVSTNVDGRAYGEGGAVVGFPDSNSVRLSGQWANDQCGPSGGDGRGIYIYVNALLRDREGYYWKRLGLVAADRNGGCGNTPSTDYEPRRWTLDRKVHGVRIKLCEENRSETGTTCLQTAQRDLWNPNVRRS